MEAAASVGYEPPSKNGPHRPDRRTIWVYSIDRNRDNFDLEEERRVQNQSIFSSPIPRATPRINETAITNVWNRKRGEVQGTRMRTILHAYCDFCIEYLGE